MFKKKPNKNSKKKEKYKNKPYLEDLQNKKKKKKKKKKSKNKPYLEDFFFRDYVKRKGRV